MSVFFRFFFRTLQVLACSKALVSGKHWPFLRGHPPSHADQTRLEVLRGREEERVRKTTGWVEVEDGAKKDRPDRKDEVGVRGGRTWA